MIATPDEVYSDAEVVARTREILRTRGNSPRAGQPSGAQLRAALMP